MRDEGQRVLGWREVPVDVAHVGRTAGACRPAIRQLFVGAPETGAIRPGRLRAQALRDPARQLPTSEIDRRPRMAVRGLELRAHDQLQGHADQLSARRLLPGPARRALQERDGARALALLDQHVPQLGARAPLPRDLPQRRDQHGDGQHQLDARPRERARRASCSARTCRRSCRSPSSATPTRQPSTRCSSC